MEREKAGLALCPYDPQQNSTAVYVGEYLSSGGPEGRVAAREYTALLVWLGKRGAERVVTTRESLRYYQAVNCRQLRLVVTQRYM